MKILIAGASGFVGQALVAHWQSEHQVFVLGRNRPKLHRLFPDGHCLEWKELSTVNPVDFDVVVNLAGESINHIFWTDALKEKMLQSRITATHALVNWLNSHPSSNIHFLNASALSIYGLYHQCPSPLNTEQTPIRHQDTFLSQVALAWEKATHDLNAAVPLSILRFAVIFGTSGGAFPKLALAAKFGLASKLGHGNQPFAWISIEDLLKAIDFIIDHKITGPINMVSPGLLTQDQLNQTLCQHMHRPYFFHCPEKILRLCLGQMTEELLLEGQAAYPGVLIQHAFVFDHPELTLYLERS